MSEKRSVWKNTPEGRTIRRNVVATYYGSRPVELMESFALRVLSRAAHLALLRIEVELRRHAGRDSGKLIVTKEQFIEFGVERRSIAPALRELDALGIIIITERGRGGNAEHRQPNRFKLNYLCGAIDDPLAPTDAWKRFKTIDEAEQVAGKARNAKDPIKVAYGRKNAVRQNISRVRKTDLKPGPKNGPETQTFSGPENGPTVPGPENGPTCDISGGGGGRGGRSHKGAAVGPIKPKPLPLKAWTAPILIQTPWTAELRQLQREAADPAKPVPADSSLASGRPVVAACQRPEPLDDLTIPEFLRRRSTN
jgi:hypothetical protein